MKQIDKHTYTVKEIMQSFLSHYNINFFSADEILFLGDRNAVLKTNTLPPIELLPNIFNTLKVLNTLRLQIKEPIHILSGYRNEVYNKQIGGSSKSQHLKFNALDFKCDVPNYDFIVSKIKRIMADTGIKGGIGKYGSFVHLDTRGYNVYW